MRQKRKKEHNRGDDVLYIYLYLVCKRKIKQRLMCATDGAHQRISLFLCVSLYFATFFYETTVVVVVFVVVVFVVVEPLLERCSLFFLPLVVSLLLIA